MTAAPLTVPVEDLIACPHCDALHRATVPAAGRRAACRRCGAVLIAPRTGSYLRVLLLAVTVMILMVGAVFFPFLELRVAGLHAEASVFDAARVFAGGQTAPLAVAVAALIVFIPIARAFLVSYVLTPLVVAGRAPRHAAAAFRLSEDLRPWSMAEIFVIGVAVALVKVTDIAHVVLGPAFWMFCALVVVTVLHDGFMCRWSLWRTLEQHR